MNENSERRVFSSTIDEVIDEGTYEVLLETAQPSVTSTGKEFLELVFRIRSDVKQAFPNWVLREKLWKDDDPNWTSWYDHRKLHRIILTQPKPRLDFKNCDDCIQYINGLAMKVDVGIREYTDNSGETRHANEVKRYSYARSEVGDVKPAATAEAVKDVTVDLPAGVEDADLPF